MHPSWVSWCRSEHRVSALVWECGEEQDAGFGGCGALATVWMLLWCSREGSGSISIRKYRSCSAVQDALLNGGVLCGKQTLSRRDVPLSVFTKSSSIVHKSREH